MMVRLPCRGSRPPTQDENREQPYLQKARTAVTSSSWKYLETSTVDEPITTWSWDFRNEDALRWLRIYRFDSNRFRQWVKTYWLTNLLNMVQNSNEIFQIGFWAQPIIPLTLLHNDKTVCLSFLNINICSKTVLGVIHKLGKARRLTAGSSCARRHD